MRIAVCGKARLFVAGLVALLGQAGYQVVATEQDPRELVTGAAKRQGAEAVVLDAIGLEHDDLVFLLGARAYAEFRVVLIVDAATRPSYERAGVDVLVDRESGERELFEALGDPASGLRMVPPLSSIVIVPETKDRDELTQREEEIARLVAQGMSNRQISENTGIGEQSVKNVVSAVMRKLRCDNRVQVALRLAQRDSRG